MLRALTRMLGRGAGRTIGDDAQLALGLDAAPAPRDANELLARLRGLGLQRIERCRLTSNRNVMVSFRGNDLRVHEGYLDAPEDVHRAIVVFVQGRTRADRRAARRRITSYTIDTGPPSHRRERTHPDDEPLAARLTEWHGRLNAEHFAGHLRAVPVRVSRRMKSRLGHYTAATTDAPGEIAISRRHLRRHGWDEGVHTLLHEMVHQWQDETGLALDHGPRFRAKAREVGIEASARRRSRSG
jgi:SprT-like family protein